MPLFRLLPGLLLLAPTLPVAAAPFTVTGTGACPDVANGASLTICTRAFGFNGPRFETEVAFPGGVGSETQSDGGSQANGNAVVASNLGFASVDLFTEKFGTTSFGSASVTGWASWTDTVTIDAPGLTGQSGTFQAAMLVSLLENQGRNLGTALSANTNVAYRVDIVTDGTGWAQQGNIGFFESQVGGFEDRTGGDPAGVFVTGDLGFAFGTPFTLNVESRLLASSDVNGGPGTALATASASFGWLGLVGVQDQSGAEVTNFSLASGTGTNWAQSIPEPHALVLFAAVAWALRRLRP